MAGLRTEYLGRLGDGRELVRCASELGAEAFAEDKPRWIHILPGGTKVEARDGRKFTVEQYEDVAANSELPMLVDWEHASESGDTRAAGWVEELKVEPAEAGSKAGIWGRVNWTDKGTGDVSGKQFRFLSPVVVGRREKGEFVVQSLRSVALTNRPALRMHGIEAFREQLSHQLGPITDDAQHTEPTMDAKLRGALASAFGLQPEATDEQLSDAAKPILAALKSTNEAQSLREAAATLTTELNAERKKVAELEQELASFRATKSKSDVEAFFAEGARAGKIPPASRERWLAFALKSEANFETFKTDIYPGLAPIGGRAPTSKPPKSKQEFSEKSPHGVNRKALKVMGFTEEQILASEAEVFERSRGPGEGEGEEDEDDADDDDDDGEGQPGAGEGAAAGEEG